MGYAVGERKEGLKIREFRKKKRMMRAYTHWTSHKILRMVLLVVFCGIDGSN